VVDLYLALFSSNGYLDVLQKPSFGLNEYGIMSLQSFEKGTVIELSAFWIPSIPEFKHASFSALESARTLIGMQRFLNHSKEPNLKVKFY
jgi:hypothetical protein